MNHKIKKFSKLIVIIITIILLIIAFLYFGRLNDYLPTGNVDIFYIDINCNHPIGDDTGNDKNDFADGEYNRYPIFTDKEQYTLGEVFVDDKNGNYIYQQKLNVFTNPAYQMKEIIAPGSSNTYHFVVHNSVDTEIRYKVEMYEKTEYPVNMKYRLKLNNQYVVGDKETWVSANDLKLSSIYLVENDLSVYALEWKWFDSENDSIIGENMESLYQLNIRINFESVI